MKAKNAIKLTLTGSTTRKLLADLEAALASYNYSGSATAVAQFIEEDAPQYPLVIEIKRRRPKRKTDQNALYWTWLQVIGDELGYDRDELHNALRAKFLDRTTGPFGIPVPVSTTSLTVGEFSEYLNKVERFAAEYGIALPKEVK